jgi:hypothetical protein
MRILCKALYVEPGVGCPGAKPGGPIRPTSDPGQKLRSPRIRGRKRPDNSGGLGCPNHRGSSREDHRAVTLCAVQAVRECALTCGNFFSRTIDAANITKYVIVNKAITVQPKNVCMKLKGELLEA